MSQDEDRKTVTKDLSRFVPKKTGVQQSAYLLVLVGENAGAIYQIEGDEFVIGRSPGCNVVLQEEGISRQHAKLMRLPDGRVVLRDLGSTNGTFVNSQPVRFQELSDGDRLQLGDVTLLKFSHSDEVEESFQRRLYESSVRDALTGVFNRRHLDERLQSEFSFSVRHKIPFAFILFDLDHFKQVNDTHGHLAGDEVLRAVGSLLSREVRAEDLVARYGGEELVVLARGTALDQGALLAERLRAAIAALEIDYGEVRLRVTVSAGVAAYDPTQYQDAKALVTAADRALYEAKRQGRNRVVALCDRPL